MNSGGLVVPEKGTASEVATERKLFIRVIRNYGHNGRNCMNNTVVGIVNSKEIADSIFLLGRHFPEQVNQIGNSQLAKNVVQRCGTRPTSQHHKCKCS